MINRQSHQRASHQARRIPGVQDAKTADAVLGIERAGERVDHRFHQPPAQALHGHADQQAGIGRQAQPVGPRHDRKPRGHQGGGGDKRPAKADFRQNRADQQQGDGKAGESRAQHGRQAFTRGQGAKRIKIFRLNMHGGCGTHTDGRARGEQSEQGNDENMSATKIFHGRSARRRHRRICHSCYATGFPRPSLFFKLAQARCFP